MMLSLVQTSQNRRQELIRFINSLNNQIGIDFSQIQLIFIDQGDNLDLFGKLNPQIKFDYIKHHLCSLSHARNIGLCHVSGEYIGFPDDDCWYEKNTLKNIIDFFSEGYQGVVAKGTDENGILTNDFPSEKKLITMYNHCGAISYTIFLKFIPSLRFDEKIGVGSPFGLSSGEETDYLLQSLYQLGTKMLYDPTIIVHHPSNGIGLFKDSIHKQYEYARGWGYLLYKHKYPFSIILKSFLRPCGGIIVFALNFKFNRVKRSFSLLKGRIEGFLIAMKNGKSWCDNPSL